MRTYTVNANASLPAEEERLRFVKEGIAWWALVTPLFWFLYHRLWWEAAAYFGLSFALALGGEALGAGEDIVLVASLFVQLLVALEANDLRRLGLARKGYRSVSVVSAQNEADAELRFHAIWKGPLPMADPAPVTSAVFDRRGEASVSSSSAASAPVWPKPGTQPAARPDNVLGLFPNPSQPGGGAR